MYNNNKDSYSDEKIKLLRTNIGEYWCGLDKKNKVKYLNLINAKLKNIDHYDNFVKYGWNVEIDVFKEKFYDNDFDFQDKKNIKKIQMLRNDLTRFWKTLSEEEKKKYIDLVKENI